MLLVEWGRALDELAYILIFTEFHCMLLCVALFTI